MLTSKVEDPVCGHEVRECHFLDYKGTKDAGLIKKRPSLPNTRRTACKEERQLEDRGFGDIGQGTYSSSTRLAVLARHVEDNVITEKKGKKTHITGVACIDVLQ
jgi:hypothetical protein